MQVVGGDVQVVSPEEGSLGRSGLPEEGDKDLHISI
jgi:hypothetical protein